MPRLRPDNTLLLVIDVQEKLAPHMQDDARMRRRAAALAQGCHLLGVPVYVTEQYPKGLGHTVPELRPAVEAAGGVFEKTAFSAVDDESIRARLAAANRPSIVLCGIEAHVCVLQTAIDLVEAGASVFVVEDAVSSRTEQDKQAGLMRAMREGAWPATVEMVLFELMGDSTHPKFKDVQRLIK